MDKLPLTPPDPNSNMNAAEPLQFPETTVPTEAVLATPHADTPQTTTSEPSSSTVATMVAGDVICNDGSLYPVDNAPDNCNQDFNTPTTTTITVTEMPSSTQTVSEVGVARELPSTGLESTVKPSLLAASLIASGAILTRIARSKPKNTKS